MSQQGIKGNALSEIVQPEENKNQTELEVEPEKAEEQIEQKEKKEQENREEKSTWIEFVRANRTPILLLLCGLIISVLWLLQVSPYLNVADDSGRYMVLGESLARDGSLRLLNDARQPLDTLYPPLFPAIIAFWMRVTGRDAMGVVLLVKLTQLVLLLCTLPMLACVLKWAALAWRTRAATLVLYAFCPALIGYANEVMSEMPMLSLCFASVLCAERTAHAGNTNGERRSGANAASNEAENGRLKPRYALRLLALFLAAGAFLVRSSGIALLVAQIVWFWRNFGWKWGLGAALVSLVVVGGWIRRNSQIVKTHPEIHYSTYTDQFSLRNPMKPGAGRIQLNARGLASRLKSGLPVYMTLISRAILHLMAPVGSRWLVLFYSLAVSLTLLILIGIVKVWLRGVMLSIELTLCSEFAALFWFTAALWPWQNARFLVPLLPFLFLFAAVGMEWTVRALPNSFHENVGAPGLLTLNATLKAVIMTAQALFALLLLLYFGYVNVRLVQQERKPTAPGYTFGRTKAEGGFYLACDWLRHHTDPKDVVMGKPQYLVHLYASNFTTQIEPTLNAKNLEKAHFLPEHVRYLLEDNWTWGVVPTPKIVQSYLDSYGAEWELAWTDPNGSGVRIWKRKAGN